MFFTCLIVTHVSILTSDTSTGSHESGFFGLRNAPLPLIYNPIIYKPVASVCSFSPVTSSAQKNLDLDQ